MANTNDVCFEILLQTYGLEKLLTDFFERVDYVEGVTPHEDRVYQRLQELSNYLNFQCQDKTISTTKNSH